MHAGQYCFNRVVMGGKNSASYFQQTMQVVLGDLVYVNVLIYIDEVLIFAKDCDKLLAAMQNVQSGRTILCVVYTAVKSAMKLY